MKYWSCIFVVFTIIIGQSCQDESSDANYDVRGYGYTSTPMILKLIDQLLDSLENLRNKELRNASDELKKSLHEVDYKTIYTQKIDELEAQFREELQTNSNQACSKVFKEMKVKLDRELLDELSEMLDHTLAMLNSALDLIEKKLKRMIVRVNRYSVEAGDCRVADNAQCELLAIYYEELNQVYEGKIRLLINQLSNQENSTPEDEVEVFAQLVSNKIEKIIRSCLSGST